MMPIGMWVVVGWMLFIVLIAILFFVWGLGTKQFKDVEEAKYKMLEDKEPAPWPGREEKNK